MPMGCTATQAAAPLEKSACQKREEEEEEEKEGKRKRKKRKREREEGSERATCVVPAEEKTGVVVAE
jgi:hypothetical protein